MTGCIESGFTLHILSRASRRAAHLAKLVARPVEQVFQALPELPAQQKQTGNEGRFPCYHRPGQKRDRCFLVGKKEQVHQRCIVWQGANHQKGHADAVPDTAHGSGYVGALENGHTPNVA